jgi:homospermidine synthase
MDGLHSVYIVVDSLDECAKFEREKTLQWVCQTVLHTNLHMVVASRPERDIIDVLKSLDVHNVDLVKESTNHDISMYLEQQVSLLKKWDAETRDIVKSTLTERAEGMYAFFY